MRLMLSLIIFSAVTALASASDWPAYRGTAGHGISAESIPANSSAAPKRLWRIDTRNGFSSFAVSGDKAFTVVTREHEGIPSETCIAVDAASGKELWAVPTGATKYDQGGDSGAEENKGGDGPRSTPAVKDGRVFVYSSSMMLHCLDAMSGKPLWKKNIIGEFGGSNIKWQSAMSPVLDGALVFVAGGGHGQSLLAFDQKTGALAWKSGDEQMTHATPTVATIHGVR